MIVLDRSQLRMKEGCGITSAALRKRAHLGE
jgi:hypothetical protein